MIILAFSLFSCGKTTSNDINGDSFESNSKTQSNETDINDNKSQVIQNASYEYKSPDELQEMADLIFIGEFTGQTNQIIPDDELGKEMPDNIYTDHVMKTVDIIKGNPEDTVNVRIFGGEYNGISYSRNGNPDFKEGEKYLMYLLKQNAPKTKNDSECYFLISGNANCFEINENGEPEVEGKKEPKDAEAIKSFYNSKADAAAIAKADK